MGRHLLKAQGEASLVLALQASEVSGESGTMGLACRFRRVRVQVDPQIHTLLYCKVLLRYEGSYVLEQETQMHEHRVQGSMNSARKGSSISQELYIPSTR